jgi:hypothetical protein
VSSGYTPLSFSGSVGQQYSVNVDNYADYYFFNHWDSGASTQTTTFMLTKQTTLTAYYNEPAQPANYKVINVEATLPGGASEPGVWATVKSGGVTVATGFTPFTFLGSTNATYSVTLANPKQFEFAHWTPQSLGPSSIITLSHDSTQIASVGIWFGEPSRCGATCFILE